MEVRNIVDDTKDEVVTASAAEVIICSNDIGWDNVLGRMTITATNNLLDLSELTRLMKSR